MSSTAFNLQYYLNLVASEYRTSPNMTAWLSANLQLFQDVMTCLYQFPTAYSLQSAVGPQLDVLGSILGVSRTVGFQPSGGVSPILDDGTYRLLLQATVLKNHWKGTTQELRAIWNQLFPSGTLLITDNQNMTVNLYVAAPLTSILQDLITHGYILPRPQGVLYTISIATLPMLGFDENNSFIAGWDSGHFVG